MTEAALEKIEFLDCLSISEQKALRSKAETVALNAGQHLFQQGDDANAFYIVMSGTMGIFLNQEIDEKGSKRLVALVKKGETLGELAILDGDTRSADVVALRDSELLCIRREQFEGLIEKYPKISITMSKILAERLRQTTANQGLRLRPKVLTFIAASPGIDIVEIANKENT